MLWKVALAAMAAAMNNDTKPIRGAHFATKEMVIRARRFGHFPSNFSDEDVAFVLDSEIIADLSAEIDRLTRELDCLDEPMFYSKCTRNPYADE